MARWRWTKVRGKRSGAQLEELLGAEHAATLMSHLPTEPTSGLATKDDLAAMEQRFTAEMTRPFARLDQRFAQIDERFARIEERLDRLEERADDTDANFTEVNDRLERLEQQALNTDTNPRQSETDWVPTGTATLISSTTREPCGRRPLPRAQRPDPPAVLLHARSRLHGSLARLRRHAPGLSSR